MLQPIPMPIALFKITKKKIIEDIVNSGHIYMPAVSYFRKQVIKNPSSLIWDINEASESRKNYCYVRRKGDNEWMPIFNNDPDTHLAVGANQCIFCTYSINWRLEMISEKTYSHIIPWNVIKEIVGDNSIEDYAILLFEFPFKTLEKFNQKLKENNYIGAWGYIGYDNHNFIPNEEQNANEYALEVCFHKDVKFSGQNEFRFVALNSKDEAIKNLYLGKLDDDEYNIIDIVEQRDLEITVTSYIDNEGEYEGNKCRCISVDNISHNWK